jgi:hypothetical protein
MSVPGKKQTLDSQYSGIPNGRNVVKAAIIAW